MLQKRKCPEGQSCRIEEGKAVCQDMPPIDVCSLHMSRGSCKMNIPRFYFCKEEGECKPFDYGGCRGNANRFKSLIECEQRCEAPENIDTGAGLALACRMPRQAGWCRARIPRWYFNTETLACTPFTYGGCKGNDNNFSTQDKCEQRCIVKP